MLCGKVTNSKLGNFWKFGGRDQGKQGLGWERVHQGILPYCLPSKAPVLTKGIDLWSLEIICNSMRSPGLTWILTTLPCGNGQLKPFRV